MAQLGQLGNQLANQRNGTIDGWQLFECQISADYFLQNRRKQPVQPAMNITAVGLDNAISNLNQVVKNLKKELAIAAWKAGKKSDSRMAKTIGSELATPQREIKKTITVKKTDVGSEVELEKTRRISLREFRARQNKSGVSAKVSKKRGTRTIPSAFQGPKPGVMKASWKGHVFKRQSKARLPIIKLRGPSPWGVFVKNDNVKPEAEDIRADFLREILERIRFNTLKNAGVI